MRSVGSILRLGETEYVVYRPPQTDRPVPLVLAHGGRQMAECAKPVVQILEAQGVPPFVLAARLDVEWDRDYTPWASECMPGREFSGCADRYLARLEDEALPALSQRFGPFDKLWSVGYSLGGLCAMYSLTRSGLYAGAASISGALWYEGFEAYFESHRPACPMYFSLGKAEVKTRNALMRQNGEITQRLASGEGSVFEWNNGNHFFEVPQRFAKAIAWLLTSNG